MLIVYRRMMLELKHGGKKRRTKAWLERESDVKIHRMKGWSQGHVASAADVAQIAHVLKVSTDYLLGLTADVRTHEVLRMDLVAAQSRLVDEMKKNKEIGRNPKNVTSEQIQNMQHALGFQRKKSKIVRGVYAAYRNMFASAAPETSWENLVMADLAKRYYQDEKMTYYCVTEEGMAFLAEIMGLKKIVEQEG